MKIYMVSLLHRATIKQGSCQKPENPLYADALMYHEVEETHWKCSVSHLYV